MKLVDGWQKAYKWLSVQMFALLAALPFVWAELPPEVKAMIPPEYRPYIVAGLAFAGIVLRMVKQK